MDLSFSEEQNLLRDSVARFVKQDYDFDTRRKIINSELGYSKNHWQLFAELGWLMVPFSEADGGLGGSAVDLIVLMEEFGKGMVIEPFLATAVLSGGLVAAAGTQAQKQSLLEPLMQGQLQLAFAFNESQSRYNLADIKTTATQKDDGFVINGDKAVVLNGARADKVIVAARTSGSQCDQHGLSLFILDADSPGIGYSPYPTVDGFRAAEMSLQNVVVTADNIIGEPDSALPIIEQCIDCATLATCAEAVGAMEVAYKKTVEYSKTRKQFGVPIGSFQALQHRMAEMFMQHEQAKSMLLMAAMQCDAAGGVDARAISAAKSRIGKAARLVGQEAIQIHGGIGVTDELDVGHYFKRLTTFQFTFGSTDYHSQRYARLAGI